MEARETESSVLRRRVFLLPLPVAGMASREHFSQLRCLNLGVNLRGMKIAVPEDLLDMPDVGSSFEKVSRAGVPESVRMDRVRDPGHLAVAMEERLNRAPAQSPSRPSDKEGLLLEVMKKIRPSFVEVELERPQTFSWNRKHAIFASLSVPHPELFALEIHVGDIQSPALLEPHPRAVKRLQERSVPQPDAVDGRRRLEKAAHLGPAQDGARKPLRTGKTDCGSGVAEKDAPFLEKGEETPHHHETRALSEGREGRASPGFARLQMAHEGDDVRWHHQADVVDALLSQELEENIQSFGVVEVALGVSFPLQLFDELLTELLEVTFVGEHGQSPF